MDREQITQQARDWYEKVLVAPRRVCTHAIVFGLSCVICAGESPTEVGFTIAPSMEVREVREMVFSPSYEPSAELRRVVSLPTSFDSIDHGPHGASGSFASSSALSGTQIFRAG